MRARSLVGSFVLAGVSLFAVQASAVSFEWVKVRDPGNAPDDAGNCLTANCGSVPYEYWISKYEVTNAQYAEYLNAKWRAGGNWDDDTGTQRGIVRVPLAEPDPDDPDAWFDFVVLPGWENKPVNWVRFDQAVGFVNWLSNGQGDGDFQTGAYTRTGPFYVRNPGATLFLPTEHEWYKAAFYDPVSASYFDFPTRSNSLACAAPTGASGTANCGGAVGGLTDVGSYPGSRSPSGTFDQAGNVSEWTELLYTDPEIGSLSRIYRGGSYFTDASAAAAHRSGTADPLESWEGSGFRIVSLAPEPGTALIVMLGLTALAKGHRR